MTHFTELSTVPEEPIDLLAPVEGEDGIKVIRASENCRGWNGIRYKLGMSAKNVGSTKLSMNVATIPPGGVCLLYTSPSPRDGLLSRMPSSA